MVFQNPDNQIVSSIVEDDVAFGPENLGIPPAEIRERVDRALKQVNMYEHRLKGAHMLSGGQKQRIAIAGAVAMRPDCIVFDEPTAMLDPKGRESVMSIIRQLNSEGITAILITHFMSEAAQADRIVVLKNGKVLADRAPREIFSDRELIRDAGLELPPVIQLREELGMPDSVMTAEDMIAELRKQCQ
jgi:energy-coupling factor transporter ATP-binding protein EcfA2